MRVLLIEDDPTLGEGLRDYLGSVDLTVHWCQDLGQTRALDLQSFDAWLIDWQLPDGSGLDWLRRLRSQGKDTPALILSARDLLEDRVRGLDGGADDYLVKPFAPEELAARLRALLRRRAGNAQGRVKVGSVEVDVTARAVWLSGEKVALTAREWSVLEALVLRAGRIVRKSELEAMVLGQEAEVSSNALEVHVSGLRRKLGHALIETVRGLGYRLETD